MSTKQMIWANFSVKDAKLTDQFYKELGFTPFGNGDDPKLASFLFGKDGFVIHFFQQGSQIDEFITPGQSNSNEIIFSLSADTEQEVNDFADKVKDAGGNLIKPVRRDEAGYFGFAFTDPDGHKFNMVLMDNM